MASTTCYNRGCGKSYNPRDNPDNSCQYHPGAPFFHDAYKGWTCCNKKSTDFTMFLSFPGCTQGQHSNVKPEEPESITGQVGESNNIELPQVNEVRPNRESLESVIRLQRPDFNKATLTRMKPTVAPALIEAAKDLGPYQASVSSTEVAIGEQCKNSGCKGSYQGNESQPGECQHHPGVPIFHEGMKFWSCCQRKTSDFQSFLNQAGCEFGKHKWKKDSEGSAQVECRYDWHQTASHVVVAIYAKKYDPDSSYIEVSPVRLKCHVVFPEQGGSFNMDIELRGIIAVKDCSVSFLGTKVEIKMKKAEVGSWSRLDVPKVVAPKKEKTPEPKVEEVADDVDDLDLDDIGVLSTKATLSKEASGGRTQADII